MAAVLDTAPVIEVEEVSKATVTKPPIIHEYIVPEYTKGIFHTLLPASLLTHSVSTT